MYKHSFIMYCVPYMNVHNVMHNVTIITNIKRLDNVLQRLNNIIYHDDKFKLNAEPVK